MFVGSLQNSGMFVAHDVKAHAPSQHQTRTGSLLPIVNDFLLGHLVHGKPRPAPPMRGIASTASETRQGRKWEDFSQRRAAGHTNRLWRPELRNAASRRLDWTRLAIYERHSSVRRHR